MEDFRKYAVEAFGLEQPGAERRSERAKPISQSLYSGRASVERDTDGCVFPFDDGSYHILGNPDR